MTVLADFNAVLDEQLARIQGVRFYEHLVDLHAKHAKKERESAYTPVRRYVSSGARYLHGLCMECPELAREGHVYCERCAARRRINQQKRRDARKAERQKVYQHRLIRFRAKESSHGLSDASPQSAGESR